MSDLGNIETFSWPKKKEQPDYKWVVDYIDMLEVGECAKVTLVNPQRQFPAVLWHLIDRKYGMTRAYRCKMLLRVKPRYGVWVVQRIENAKTEAVKKAQIEAEQKTNQERLGDST